MKKLLQSVATKWQELSLLLRIFIGLVIGAVLGLTCPQLTGISILGQLFVSALKAVAPVLVAVLVAASIAKAQGGLGSRFRTVIVLYMVSTMCAAFTAVAGSFLFPVEISLADAVNDEAPSGLVNIFTGIATNMVANPIQAIANANYIGVLFWAIVVGFALKLRASEATIKVVDDFSETISLVVKWVIQFAPFGILGLVFTSVSESGMDIFITYGKLVALLVGCMLFSCLILNPLIVALCIHKNPYPLVLTCLKESGINAFFTRSSAANIPINMALCKRLGINEDFYSVSIPLGATINMNGAAVTITVMTLAVCHTLGLQVDIVSALFLSVLAALGACGTSGVAGGSLLLIPMACSLFGVSNGVAMQAVAVGFIISVIQDSLETAINSSGDAIFTATADLMDKKNA